MAALPLDKLLCEDLDFGVVCGVENTLVIVESTRFRIERDFQRLLAALRGSGDCVTLALRTL